MRKNYNYVILCIAILFFKRTKNCLRKIRNLRTVLSFRISKVDCFNNTALPVVTADLAKLSIDINSSPTESTKRILRKRIPKSAAKTDVLNRR